MVPGAAVVTSTLERWKTLLSEQLVPQDVFTTDYGGTANIFAGAQSAFIIRYGPQLKQFIGHENQLPFDQHCLIALVAPRAFITTEALGDQWANPPQTYKSVQAAKLVWDFLGAFDQTAIHYREGKHAHDSEDWTALLDFADKIFFNKPTTRPFDQPPA